MPQSFSKRNISDAENRLRLLFCVAALGPVTKEQLWPFVAELELMEYVPMCLYVTDLMGEGSLCESMRPLDGALCLTDEGQRTLRLFERRLPQADAERIRRAAPGYAALLAEKRQIRAVHELAPAGKYRVACAVTEGDLPTLLLRLETTSKRLAIGVTKRFRARASRLLTCLYTLETQPGASPFEPEESALEPDAALKVAAPDRWLLCGYGGRQQAGVICLSNRRVEIRLALLMPSAQAAAEWLGAVRAAPDALLNRICAILSGKEPSA